MQYDRNFLLELDKVKNKTVYAKITKLTFDEYPIEEIEGKVTGGSINIDGTSAVRRTCSLTLLADRFKYSDFYCGLYTKFKLEIGVENLINSNYPEIIWFKQGIYLVTSFSTSRSTSNFTISINGKDKMCLLNGDVGGSLTSSVDFGQIEEEDIYGNWTMKKIPIKEIIKNIVHIYGKEAYHNIIINDLEDLGAELMEYRYDIPLYLYRKIDNKGYEQATFDGDMLCYVNGTQKTLGTLEDSDFENLNNLITTTQTKIKFSTAANADEYYITRIQYGETCGYRLTDLIFAGDLISNIGESLTSVLDKIKNMLVEFEYFYNIDGQFIFQKKPSTVSVMQNLDPTSENEEMEKNLITIDSIYAFEQGETLTSLNINPNLLNIKNDYAVWGERVTASGTNIPIHIRYAIDKKPIQYTTINVASTEDEVRAYAEKHQIVVSGQTSKTYRSDSYWENGTTLTKCDWREVLYQMASDYYKYNFLSDFYQRVAQANGNRYPNGITGYENYYIDIYSFWRDLYYPLDKEISQKNSEKTTINSTISELNNQVTQINNQIVGYQTIINNASSTSAEKEDAQKNKNEKEIELNIIDNQLSYLKTREEELIKKIEELEKEKENYFSQTETSTSKRCWNKMVFLQSYNLNFWFDFLDTQGVLSQYSVQNIGNRTKTINENSLKALTYNKIPNVIYYESSEVVNQGSDYAYIQVGSQYTNMFSISCQGKSLQDRLNELINAHSFYLESATINAIPVYYLEPNSRILLTDKETNLNDIYLVSKITLPLTYNGTMSLTANKIYDSLV